MSGYREMANGIVLLAVKDYRSAEHPAIRASIERVFRSRWFQELSGLDGEKLTADLRRERDAV